MPFFFLDVKNIRQASGGAGRKIDVKSLSSIAVLICSKHKSIKSAVAFCGLSLSATISNSKQ